MWDLYASFGSNLVRMALSPDGATTEVVSQCELPGTVSGLRHVANANAIAVVTDQGVTLADRSLDDSQFCANCLGFSPDGTMAFGIEGVGPTFDLAVQSLDGDKQKLLIADLHVAQKTLLCVDAIDSLMLIDGDPGTTIARNILVVPLAQIRHWMAEGVTRVDRSMLDYHVLNGGTLGIPLDHTTRWTGIDGYPGFVVFWWVQKPNEPMRSEYVEIEFPYWDADLGARSQILQHTAVNVIENCAISHVFCRRADNGGFNLVFCGVGRRRSGFFPEFHTLSVDDREAVLHVELRDAALKSHVFKDIELRHSSSLFQLTSLPEGTGALIVAEDPFREERLYRLDFRGGNATMAHLELDDAPGSILVLDNAQISTVDSSLEAEAPEQPEAPAKPAGDSCEDAPLPVESVSSGQSSVLAEVGLDLPLGVFPAHAHLNACVVVVGEGRGAQINSWLSQARGPGDVVYQLHIRATEQCTVRWSVRVA